MIEQGSIPVRTSSNIQDAIGRRLYPDPHLCVCELVSNSFDANASNVYLTITSNKIVVKDDGWGMSESVLDSFFTVGKSTKPTMSSGRKPIGTFGIGKFAILSMADNFTVFTKTEEGFRAKASYSHDDSINAGEYLNDYSVPVLMYNTEEEYRLDFIEEVGEDLYNADDVGVCIVMYNLHRVYSDEIIHKKVAEIITPNSGDTEFNVYINDRLVEERYIHGLRYDLNVDTEYGAITGEIVIAAESIDLGDQEGIQVQVQNRGIYRTHFGMLGYDASAKRLTGHVIADWLQSKISSSRTELIDSPEKTAFENATKEALRSILDKEAQKRSIESEDKRQKILDKAVRGVTRVLNNLPEFDFPRRALESMIPISALDEVLAGKDTTADIEPTGDTEASVTANRGESFSELLDYLRQIAPQYNVNPSEVPSEVRTVAEALSAIEKVLGISVTDLIEPEMFDKLLGSIKEEELQDEERVRGALKLAAHRLEDIVKQIAQEQIQDTTTENAQLSDGVTLHTPITNSMELSRINLSPIAPPLDSVMLDLNVNPLEDGFAPDAPQANLNSYVATSLESLGEQGPASMVAEGIGFTGIQIYINTDHMVYQSILEETPNMINYHICSLIFSEVILLQNFTPREAIDKQAELMRSLLSVNKNLLKG